MPGDAAVESSSAGHVLLKFCVPRSRKAAEINHEGLEGHEEFRVAMCLESGEHRQLACIRRQPADETVFGKLPKTTGWQPVLPGKR